MVKSAFSNIQEKKTVFNSNLYIQLNTEVNTLIEKINGTTNQTLIRMWFRKIYILITFSRLPYNIKILCTELLNAIKNIVFINAVIPNTIIYCMIVPN